MRRYVGLLVLVTLAASLTSPSSAMALDGSDVCDPNGSEYAFAGTVDELAYTGFYSHLDPQALHICTGPGTSIPRGAFAWAAVESGDCVVDCFASIVQIGRGLCQDAPSNACQGSAGGQRLLVAWGRDHAQPGCSAWLTVLPFVGDKGPAPTDTGLHYYRVHDDGAYWRWTHWPKGQAVTTVKSLDDVQICWTVREGVTFNEIWNLSDALGGWTANHYNYLSMTRQVAIGGTWQASLGNSCFVTLPVPYLCQTTSAQAWEAWTNR